MVLPAKCLCIILLLALVGGCSQKIRYPGRTGSGTEPTQQPYVINGRTYYPIPSAEGYRETGIASWYGPGFDGRLTANGETYDMDKMTAAHKTLPMGTVLLVRNLENGRSAVVRINDRGPFARNRIIDLSRAAATRLDMLQQGTARVEIVAMAESSGRKGRQAAVRGKHRDFDQGEFYIQVGAFASRENARRLARRFAARGRNVKIQGFYPRHDGTFLYRVLVYSGSSLKAAERDRKMLETSGYRDAFVIAL